MQNRDSHSKLQRVQVRSMTDRAYEAIRDAIIEGEFQPGERLSEERLGEQLGVSKTPVHDALMRLEAEGLVDITPYIGASVVHLSPQDITEIYDVRETLERLAIRLAIGHDDAAQLGQLDEELASFSRPLKPTEFNQYFDVDHRLHSSIAEMSGNTRLARFLGMLRNQSHAARFLSSRLPGRTDRSIEEHREIIAAILAGDSDRAERAMQVHLSGSRKAAMKIVRQISEEPATEDR